MRLRKFSYLVIFGLCLTGKFDSVTAQTVTQKFPFTALKEDFESDSIIWPVMTTADNLFIIQDGMYILNRRNVTSPYAAMCLWENNLEAFDMKVSLKIMPGDAANSFVGVVFMASDKTGFLVEFNRGRQYRVQQLFGSTYHYLTGDDKNDGWVKESNLRGPGLYNNIEVKCANKNYDLYINNAYVLSFSEKTYKSGGMGVIVGAATNAMVDNFYVYSIVPTAAANINLVEVKDTIPKDTSNIPKKVQNDPLIAMSEAVVRLKTQVNKLTAENDLLKRQIAVLENYSKPDTEKTSLKNIIDVLQKRLTADDNTIDSLLKKIETYSQVSKLMEGNETDLIISFSNSLKDERMKSDSLAKYNKMFKDSMTYYKAEYLKLKPVPVPPKLPPDKLPPDKGKTDLKLPPGGLIPPKQNGVMVGDSIRPYLKPSMPVDSLKIK